MLYERLYGQLSAIEVLQVCGIDGRGGLMKLNRRGERVLRYLRERRRR